MNASRSSSAVFVGIRAPEKISKIPVDAVGIVLVQKPDLFEHLLRAPHGVLHVEMAHLVPGSCRIVALLGGVQDAVEVGRPGDEFSARPGVIDQAIDFIRRHRDQPFFV